MKIIELLTGPSRDLIAPGVIAAIAIALSCSALSVIVVPKRLAFLGQGITHAAFGGVGIAAILGLSVGAGFAVVAAFCILAAIVIGLMTGRERMESNTAIAVVLVASMALGGALVHIRLTRFGPTPMAGGWESLIFGSIRAVAPTDAVIAWVVAPLVLVALWWLRRPMLFWAFDENAAETFGVRVGAIRIAFLALCAVTIVISMKLAGVVLVTALLVLPGATAMAVSRRLGVVVLLSLLVGVVGVLGGLALAIETDLPAGPAIVGGLVGEFALFGGLTPLIRWFCKICLRSRDEPIN